MDIFSHGLWAAILGKLYKNKTGKKLNLRWAFFWGVFPDLVAFTPSFIWLGWALTLGGMTLGDIPRAHGIEPAGEALPIFQVTQLLYNFSHSIVIFVVVLSILVLLRYALQKKELLYIPLLGWPLHILADIPTHSYRFYPTPFLWPFSEWKFNGFSWGQPWFMIVNYSVMIVLLIVLWRKR